MQVIVEVVDVIRVFLNSELESETRRNKHGFKVLVIVWRKKIWMMLKSMLQYNVDVGIFG